MISITASMGARTIPIRKPITAPRWVQRRLTLLKKRKRRTFWPIAATAVSRGRPHAGQIVPLEGARVGQGWFRKNIASWLTYRYDTTIDLAAANFENGPFGSRIKSIQFVAPSIGTLTGEGTVSPMHELDFKMSAVVKTGGLLAAAIRQRGDTTTVPFFIQGTSANPVFKADVKSIANEKLQQVINNPEGAVKNAKDIADTAKGLINLFKKAPAKEQK